MVYIAYTIHAPCTMSKYFVSLTLVCASYHCRWFPYLYWIIQLRKPSLSDLKCGGMCATTLIAYFCEALPWQYLHEVVRVWRDQ